jgi:formylglycine-generating enzyme required for sulfatase activity
LDRIGWYEENSGGKLHPVGEKKPNKFCLYDMHGNIWEWVEDDWRDRYYRAPDDGGARIDVPRDKSRVVHGGNWYYSTWYCRSTFRMGDGPFSRYAFPGFRLAFLPGQGGIGGKP